LTPINYKPGSIIFQEGEVADQFYIIIKGQVEIIKQHESGQEFILSTLSRGQYFGEMGLFENSRRNATARAHGDSEVILMALDRDTFSKLMTDSKLMHSSIADLMRQRTTVNHLLAVLPTPAEAQFVDKPINHELMTYEPGSIICRRGDIADKFYLIIQGEVDVMHPYHQDVPIARLMSGQYFGEVGVLQGGKRGRTTRAAPDSETDVKVIAIERDSFRQLITGNTILEEEIALTMRHYLSERLVEFMPDLRRRARKSNLLKEALIFDDNKS
jgi:CRP-like cAMP-binding protein